MAATLARPQALGQGLRRQSALAPLLILNTYLAGVYLNLHIYSGGGILVPNVLTMISVVLMVISNPRFYTNDLAARLGWIALFLTLWTIFGGSGLAYIGTRATSLLQMVAGIGAAHIAMLNMARMRRPVLRKVAGWWLALIVAGIALEVAGILRPASDWFRDVAFSQAWLYEGQIRDLEIYGAVRPKLFTQEPSHPAKFFVAITTAWFLLSRSRYKVPILIGSTVAMLALLRSPFVMLVLPLAFGLDRMAQVPRNSSRDVFKLTILAAFGFALALLAAAIAFPARLELVRAGNDLSTYMRFYGPFVTAADVLNDYPLFGIGLGAKEFLWPYLRESFAVLGNDRYLAEVYLTLSANGFANSLMFFGLIGSAIFWWLLWRYYRTFSLAAAVVGVMLVMLFFNLDGSIEGARTWGYVAICLAAFLVSQRSHRRRRHVMRLRQLA